MNKNALKQIHDYGVSLVVTVDNGVTALEEVDYAVSIGLDVVVTSRKPESARQALRSRYFAAAPSPAGQSAGSLPTAAQYPQS